MLEWLACWLVDRAALHLVAALSSAVFSVWDLQRLHVPAMGSTSRPQPTCLLRLDLNERCASIALLAAHPRGNKF